MSFSDEKEMYPILEEYFASQGYKTLSQASFRMIKLWLIDVVAYDVGKKELIAVEAKLSLDDALDAISHAEIYQMACSKAFVAFPNVEWDSAGNKGKRRDVAEICKKRGIGILKVIGKNLTHPCEEVVKPALSVRIDLLERILHEIKSNFQSFNGLDEDDFTYFLDNQAWKRELVRKKLELLANEIKKEIPKRAPFLEGHEVKMQVMQKHYAGLNIFKARKQTEIRHYSVGLRSYGFSVFIQIPTSKLVAKFLSKAEHEADVFLSILGKSSNLELELYTRTSKALHGRPIPGGTIYKRVLRIRIDAISPEILIALIELIKRTRYPAINFTKEYDIRLLGHRVKKEDAVKFIFDSLKELSPIYDFVG